MNHTAFAFFAFFAFFALPTVASDAPRDPFASYTSSSVEGVVGGEQRCAESPVACIDLDALTVKAIATGVATPRALVETRDRRAATLRVGDLVGKGRITSISQRGVVVERVYFNATGGTVRTNVLLQIGGSSVNRP